MCRAKAAKGREAAEQRVREQQERLMRNMQLRAADEKRRREEMIVQHRQASMAKLVWFAKDWRLPTANFTIVGPRQCIDARRDVACGCLYWARLTLSVCLCAAAEADSGPAKLLPGAVCLPP